jgi:fumarylpyruvate hydrolase
MRGVSPLPMTAWKVVEGFDGLVNSHAKSIRGFEISMNWNFPTHPEFLTTDGRRLPVNRVFCIAKNYEEHAKEMGGEVDRKGPFHFQKSFDALTFGPEVHYPTQTDDLHHEVELVAVLGRSGRHLSLKDAEAMIFGYAVGLDFTRRDRQAEVKEKGRPWEIAKNFDDAGVIGVVTPITETGLMNHAAILLAVNGETRQSGDIHQMAHNTVELIAFLSTLQELKAGDLIFTGTPSGVGAVVRGDHLVGKIEGLMDLHITLV